MVLWSLQRLAVLLQDQGRSGSGFVDVLLCSQLWYASSDVEECFVAGFNSLSLIC